jgi:hypothetical protein
MQLFRAGEVNVGSSQDQIWDKSRLLFGTGLTGEGDLGSKSDELWDKTR